MSPEQKAQCKRCVHIPTTLNGECIQYRRNELTFLCYSFLEKEEPAAPGPVFRDSTTAVISDGATARLAEYMKLKIAAENGGYLLVRDSHRVYSLREVSTGKFLLQTIDKSLVKYLLELFPQAKSWTAAAALSAIAKLRRLK